jgi:hypothetical protein
MNGKGEWNGRMPMLDVLDDGKPKFSKSVSRQTHQREGIRRRGKPTNSHLETVAANPPTSVVLHPPTRSFGRRGKPTSDHSRKNVSYISSES